MNHTYSSAAQPSTEKAKLKNPDSPHSVSSHSIGDLRNEEQSNDAFEVTQLRATLKKVVEQSEEASRTKSRFLAIMSHEIRTPLNGVLGALQLLADSTPDAKQVALIEMARSSAENLRRVTNDVVDLSRLEADGLELETEKFDLSTLLDDMCDFWKPMADSKGLSLTWSQDEDAHLLVFGDSGRIRQIINNYVTNAINFTHEGSIHLELSRDQRLAQDSSAPEGIRITVEDTGIGISTDDQMRLFQDYNQARKIGDTQRGGAGLGLAICRELAKLMGGDVGLSSTLGSGSKFWIRLPLAAATPDEEQDPSPESYADLELITLENGEQPRILLVEDSATNQFIAEAFLTQFGCYVDIAADGLEAVNAAKAGDYDLYLMDIAMPRMDGVEATHQIRRLPGVAGQAPIVGQTAYAGKDDKERFLAAGMNRLIHKPLNKSILHEAVRESLVSVSPIGIVNECEPPPQAMAETAHPLEDIRKHLPEDAFCELLDRLANDIRTNSSEAVQAALQGDLKVLARTCHTLKGIGATFRNEDLMAISTEILQACKSNKAPVAKALALTSLETLTSKALEALEPTRSSYQF